MNVAPGGLRYGLPPIVGGAIAALISPVVGVLLVALGVAAIAFHRDPDRTPSRSGIVSPADGTVQVLRTEGDRVRVGVFMNVHDVHVNRAPLSGTVTSVVRKSGGYRPAFTKRSENNERVHVDIDTELGPTRVTMIAGAFARRIHPYLDGDERLQRGDRIGHISFGSRVDVLLPDAIDRDDIVVERGATVRAGESLLVGEVETGSI